MDSPIHEAYSLMKKATTRANDATKKPKRLSPTMANMPSSTNSELAIGTVIGTNLHHSTQAVLQKATACMWMVRKKQVKW